MFLDQETKTPAIAEGSESTGGLKIFRISFQKLGIPLLILANLAFAITLAARLNIWTDEAGTLHTTGRDLAYALSQAIHYELQAPFYFILLRIWRNANSSIFFAHLLSVVCILFTLLTVIKLSQRFFEAVHPGWLLALVAFNPFLIWTELEIRRYALVLLISGLMLLFFYDGFLSLAPRAAARWGYAGISILGLYTFELLGAILVANAVVLVLLRRWHDLRLYLLLLLLVGVCVSPLIILIYGVISSYDQLSHDNLSMFSGIRAVFWNIRYFVLPLEGSRIVLWRDGIFYAGALAALLLLFKRWRYFAALHHFYLVVIVVVICVFFVAIRNVTDQIFNAPSHLSPLFLPAIMLVFAVMVSQYRTKSFFFLTAVLLIFYFSSLSVRYAPMAKAGDWKQVASFLKASERSGQPILVFKATSALPLEYYYSGINRIVPLPKENNFSRFDYHDFVLHDENDIWVALSRAGGNNQSVWLITDGICKSLDFDYRCEILENFVNRNYSVELDRSFYQSRVRMLRRRSEPRVPHSLLPDDSKPPAN